MINKVKLAVYYALITKIPNSRYLSIFNKVRVYYVAKILKIMPYDKNSRFQENIYIGNINSVKIGKHCQINENVFIQEANIGSYVMIAPNTAILSSTHNHERVDVPMILQGAEKGKKVIIEDDVWLGRNVIIMPGVRVAKGAIVAAGAIVTKDVPEYSIVAGVPAKVIKKRN